jgi:protein TonB
MVAAGQDRDTTVYNPPRDGVSFPTLVKRVKPAYTPQAKAAQVQGWVMVDMVVLSDGTIGDVKVIESCLGRIGSHREPNGDPFRCVTIDERVKGVNPVNRGLDQQAVNAAKQWVFKPGMKDGKPVAVRILTRLDFHPLDSR